ncbi:MAG: hypothetical protein NW217_07195 [Hyphomicrobiaceae bacterium]|nr:hypothetical protein [Hyphomicrobiaceae bacterium]
MNANLASVIAIVVSLTGILLLAFENPKRRRAFGLPPHNSATLWRAAWILILLPPLYLLARQETAPLMMWLGALSVAGWVVAMRRPKSAPQSAEGTNRPLTTMTAWLARRGRAVAKRS